MSDQAPPSTEPTGGRPVTTGNVVTGAERDLAVGHWLLAATSDIPKAQDEWATDGYTFLPCGSLFSAVRIPAEIVHAGAGIREPAAVDDYLRAVLFRGPVIAGARWLHYYALVPASTSRHWRDRDAACLGVGTYLGVPRPGNTRRHARRKRPCWCVPMGSAGELCDPDDVAALIAVGRAAAR